MHDLEISLGEKRIPVNTIYLPADPEAYEEKAAGEIAKYLERMCGRALPVSVIGEGKPPEGAVLVGRAAVSAGLIDKGVLEPLGPDGYAVVCADGYAGVAGRRGVGTLHGSYAFMERLGVRFFSPDCVHVPEAGDLLIPEMNSAVRPAFDFRGGHWTGGDPSQGFSPNEDSPPASLVDQKCGAGWDHTANYQCPKYLYFDSHPEYYAKDETGKNREFGRLYDVQLCLTNPKVREIAADRILEWIEKQPQGKYFCVTQGDGGAWCQCPSCRALDPKPGAKGPRGWYYAELSDRLLDYVNFIARRVAKRYPDKVILTLAYTPATQPPPRRIKPEPNVKVMFCPYPTPGGAMCNSHDLFCPKNTGALKDLGGWLNWCPENVYIYDYPCGYANPSEPLGSFYAMARKIKHYSHCGIRGIFYCGGPRLFGHLFNYVMGKLMWNPDLDPDELADEFMEAYYRAAAPHMRKFMNLLYNRVDDHASPIHTYCEAPNPGLVTPEFAARAYAVFARAKDAVRKDPEALDRVEREELFGVLWADINENHPEHLIAEGRINKALLPKFRQLVYASSKWSLQSFVRRDRGRDWVVKAFGVPVKGDPWYEDETVLKLKSGKLSGSAVKRLEREMVQEDIPGGASIRLSAFSGSRGPETYSHNCPARTAVWVTPKGAGNPRMRAGFFLDKARGPGRLTLEALDDDKSGATRIRVLLNGRSVFSGENEAKENEWTELSFPVPKGILKKGRNSLLIENLEEGRNPRTKWFMVAGAKVAFD